MEIKINDENKVILIQGQCTLRELIQFSQKVEFALDYALVQQLEAVFVPTVWTEDTLKEASETKVDITTFP